MAARNPGPALFGALLGALLLGAFAMALRQRGAALYGLSRGRPGAHSFKYRMECVSQPAAGERYDAGGRVGFVFSATERYAQGMAYRCVAAIESLVRVGGWSGPVYLMASKGEACLDEAHLREVTGSPNVYVVHDFYAALRGMPGVFPGLPRAFDCGAAKAVKGAMLDIVGRLHSAAGIGGRAAPGAPPDVLIYHDCDKVVAKPGCIAEMLRAPLAFGRLRRRPALLRLAHGAALRPRQQRDRPVRRRVAHGRRRRAPAVVGPARTRVGARAAAQRQAVRPAHALGDVEPLARSRRLDQPANYEPAAGLPGQHVELQAAARLHQPRLGRALQGGGAEARARVHALALPARAAARRLPAPGLGRGVVRLGLAELTPVA